MVKIFADGADVGAILALAANPRIGGFTTNPSLLRAAGVTDYAAFAKHVLAIAGTRPVSLEVLSDDFEEMEEQAIAISRWGANAVVKIPVTNTQGVPSIRLANKLAARGVAVNLTAVFSETQLVGVHLNSRSFVSVFAGRIADAGISPRIVIEGILQRWPDLRIIWASSRELYNIKQAQDSGCAAITLTPELIQKLPLLEKELLPYSLETVQQFYRDAKASGLTI